MKPSRPLVLLAVALLLGVATYAVTQHVYGELPALPASAPAALVVLAVLEGLFGHSLRTRIRSGGGRDLNPLGVARLAVLGKASAHGGAVVAGVYGGFLVYTAAGFDKPQLAHDAVVSGVSLATALLLVAAGLWLEHACRVPPRDDDKKPHTPTGDRRQRR